MSKHQTSKHSAPHIQYALYPYRPLDPYAVSMDRFVRLARARATRSLQKTSIDDIDVNLPGQPTTANSVNVTIPLPVPPEHPSGRRVLPGHHFRCHSDPPIASPRIEEYNRSIQRTPTAPAGRAPTLRTPSPVTRPPSYRQNADPLPQTEDISRRSSFTRDTQMGPMIAQENASVPSFSQKGLGFPIRRATRENTIPLTEPGSEEDHWLAQRNSQVIMESPTQVTSSERTSSEDHSFVYNIVEPSPLPGNLQFDYNRLPRRASQPNNYSPPPIGAESSGDTKPLPVPSRVPSFITNNIDPESLEAIRHTRKESLRALLCEIVPRQTYMICLLFSPRVYFSRVNTIFAEAKMTLVEIKDVALKAGTEDSRLTDEQMSAVFKQDPPKSYQRLKQNWEALVDTLLREWKTMNIVSALLLTGILTILQIDKAAEDFYTRYTALFSFFNALISLMFGCIYIIQFATMRKIHKGAEWAIEAINEQTILWNVWVMLALPSAFLAWSILLFTASILCFMWRVSYKAMDNVTLPPVSDTLELISRIAICLLLVIGILYGIRVVREFQYYGETMDDKWRKRVDEYIHAQVKTVLSQDFLQQDYVQHAVESGPGATGTPAPGAAALLAPSHSFATLPTSSSVKRAYELKQHRTAPERLRLPPTFSNILAQHGNRV